MTSGSHPARYEAFARYLERLAVDRRLWGPDAPSRRNHLKQESWPNLAIDWLVDCGTRLRAVVDRFRTEMYAGVGDPSQR